MAKKESRAQWSPRSTNYDPREEGLRCQVYQDKVISHSYFIGCKKEVASDG